jgi:drug/metabolite transporter (DMT)-like permease
MLAIGLVAVSGAAVLVRLAPDVSAPAVAFWRLSLAAAILGAITAMRGGLARRLAELKGRYGAVCAAGVCLGAHFALWFASLHRTSVASSVVIVTTSPLHAALIERFWLGERLGVRRTCGIALGFAGAVILALAGRAHGGGRDSLAGDALAWGGALAAAGYWIAGRRARSSASLLPYAAAVYCVAAFCMLLLVAALRSPLAGFAPRSYGALVALAVVPQVIGHTALNWALRHLPAASVAGVTLGEPIGATVLAAILLHERPAPLALAGGAVTLAGVALVLGALGDTLSDGRAGRRREERYGDTRGDDDAFGGGGGYHRSRD